MATKKIDIGPNGEVLINGVPQTPITNGNTITNTTISTKDTTDKEEKKDFEIKEPTKELTNEPVIKEPVVKQDDLTDISGPGSPNAQNKVLVDEARKFNQTLVSNDEPTDDIVPATPKFYPDHNFTAKLRVILKDNGMDTQQQQKAIAQITALLFE